MTNTSDSEICKIMQHTTIYILAVHQVQETHNSIFLSSIIAHEIC